jgi:hypothetical protein
MQKELLKSQMEMLKQLISEKKHKSKKAKKDKKEKKERKYH